MGAWNGRRSGWNTLQRALAAAVLHGVCAHGDVFVPWSYSPPAAGRSCLWNWCPADFGALCLYWPSEFTKTDLSRWTERNHRLWHEFFVECYVNVLSLTRMGYPTSFPVSHNKKTAKRSQPSVSQVLWWSSMWILWSSPRPMQPVGWLEARKCKVKGMSNMIAHRVKETE